MSVVDSDQRAPLHASARWVAGTFAREAGAQVRLAANHDDTWLGIEEIQGQQILAEAEGDELRIVPFVGDEDAVMVRPYARGLRPGWRDGTRELVVSLPAVRQVHLPELMSILTAALESWQTLVRRPAPDEPDTPPVAPVDVPEPAHVEVLDPPVDASEETEALEEAEAPVRMRADISQQWSWASSAARIPQISSLVVDVAEPLGHAEIRVSVRDGEIEFGSTVAVSAAFPAGTGTMPSVHVPLSPSVMARVEERHSAHCVIELSDAGKVLARIDESVDIMPRDLWLWDGDPRRAAETHRLEQRHNDLVDLLTQNDASDKDEELVKELVHVRQRLDEQRTDGRELARALLASFVRPNHPEIAVIAREAADHLARATGDGAFHAFQRPPAEAEARADATVDAVYTALRARSITYSEPPPSWDYRTEGQRIRDHGGVAKGGLGTCMDTTVLFAAVLEQVGLHPVLMLIPGHIFVGYWRRDPLPEQQPQPDWYPGSPVFHDEEGIARLAAGGFLGVIETTTLAEPTFTPAQAKSRAQGLLAGGAHSLQPGQWFVHMIDVAAARNAGVSPLPAIHERPDGVVEVVVYRPGDTPAVTRVDPTPLQPSGERHVDDHPARYRTWKASLFSLSATNDLLNLKSNARVQPLLLPPTTLGRLEDALNQNSSFTLTSGWDIPSVWQARDIRNALQLLNSGEPQDIQELVDQFGRRHVFVQRIGRIKGQMAPMGPATFVRELRSMAHAAKTSRDERGMNPLYLCLGSLRWPYKADVWAEAPLILVPVTLTAARGRPEFTLSLDAAQQTTPNAALVEWLRRMHGLDIPGFAEPLTDGSGIDVDGVLGEVRRAVAASGLPLAVGTTAHLAILDLAAFRMWQDLNLHADSFLRRPLVNHLVHTPTETFVDAAATAGAHAGDLAEELERLETPISADSAQKQAVLWARQGRTFVLQGPPGTGRSQTITNMVAECLLSGMKVLFVAEKGTALAVVQRRLDEIGLGPFMLNLHHEGSNAALVREQLRRSLAASAYPDRVAVESARRKLRTMRHELGEYPIHLHARNAADHSAYTAHDELLVLGDGPALPVTETLVAHQPDRIAALRATFQDLHRWTTAADVRPGHPWRFAGPGTADPFDVAALSEAIRAVIAGVEWADRAEGELAAALGEVTHPRQLGVLASATHPALPAEGLRDVLAPGWPTRARLTIDNCAKEAAPYDDNLKHFHPDVMGIDLRAMLEALRTAEQSGFFGRKGRMEAAITPLQRVAPPGAVVPANAGNVLVGLIDIQTAMVRLRDQVASIPGVSGHVPANPLRPGALDEPTRRIDEIDAATAPLRGHGEWTDRAIALREAGHLTGHEEPLRRFAAAWSTLVERLAVLDHDMEVWCAGASLNEATRRHTDSWRRELDHERLVHLQRWCTLVRTLQPVLASGLAVTRDELLDGTIPGYQAEEALARGLARASLTERMRAEALDRFDGLSHESRVSTYIAAQADVRRQWVTDGPARLLEARGAGGLGSHTGGLARELEKTSRRLGTRPILRKYGQAVQQLTPLVLASPSSVVDLIEPGVMEFDVVIFDEASQITVPEAVGSLGRAQAAIVVGDTKQMPPTRKVGGQAGADEDIDDPDALEVVEDQESILSECELARVPTLSLTWHYRSQDEALIAFSNRTYYRGGLSSFPTPTLMSDATGVEFHRVHGQYLRAGSKAETLADGVTAGSNTNPIEARAIVDAVHEMVNGQDALPSIGIVTFNEPQRQLIEDLLQSSNDPRVAELLDENRMGRAHALFVKALEQVQGDERDTIIFSIAFSRQATGKIPTNFGPLSNSGGERRLNVAITRARRKNIVFCSFDPAELDVSGATFSGPKDLKEFLAFAKAAGSVDHDSGSGSGSRRSIRDRHRDDVAETLRVAGLHVITDVGLSNFRLDLVIARPERPDRPILPILLDGESWRQRTTVSDRDVLPIEVLHGLMGWPSVARIWWPMWLQNRDEVVWAILDQVAQAEAALLQLVPSSSPDPSGEPLALRQGERDTPVVSTDDERSAAGMGTIRSTGKPADVAVEPVPAVVQPEPEQVPDREPEGDPETTPDPQPEGAESSFVPAHTNVVGQRGALDALSEDWAREAVRGQLDDVIATEGPIELVRLVRIVARRFGLNAVRAARVEAISSLITPTQVRRSHLGVFVWPADLDPSSWHDFRRTVGEPLRTLDEVAPEEIANAMRVVRARQPRLEDEDLLRTTAEVFGIARLGMHIRARLESVRRMIDP